MRSRRRHRRLRRLAFSLLPLLLLAILAELAARRAWEPPALSGGSGMALVPHPTRMWALGPGEGHAFGARYQVDGDGLRAAPSSGAPLRVMTLGDSSIFGHGLSDPDTLHVQLGEALARRGIEADTLTGGVPGYSTEQTLLLMEELGWSRRPDLLVIGNLWSDHNADGFRDRELLDRLSRPSRRADLALRRVSFAWRWLRDRMSPTARQAERPQAAAGALPVGWIQEPQPGGPCDRRVPLADYAANLDRLLLQAIDHRAGAIFLAPCNRLRLAPETPASTWDAYFQAMRAVAARRGVPVVDGREVLLAAGLSADEAFLPGDAMHPRGAANAAYAEALAGALSAAGWPSRRLLPDPGPPLFDEAPPDAQCERLRRGEAPLGGPTSPVQRGAPDLLGSGH